MFRCDGETAITEDAIADGKKATISLNCSICKKNQFLAVVLEVALALRRLVDSEMVYGTGDLSPKEWESLISALDVGLSPWLVYPSVLEEQSSINAVKENGHYLQQEIYSEVMAIFSQVRSFLTKCSRPEYCGFHLIVDEECRECLHKFLLRKVCPALAENDATSMALAVIKSWCVVGYLPFREGNWCKRAADLLAESNALFDGNHGSLYPGGYVHPPAIRLKALKSLVDDQHELDVSNHSNRDSESSITMTSVSVVSGGLPVLSLFSLTRYVNKLLF